MIKEKPDYNYIYTFILKDGREASFVFKGYNEKDRVVLYNLGLKTTCTMTKDWFSFMACKKIVRKIKYYPKAIENYQTVVPEDTSLSIDEANLILNEKIEALKSATEDESRLVFSKLKITPDSLIRKLESDDTRGFGDTLAKADRALEIIKGVRSVAGNTA